MEIALKPRSDLHLLRKIWHAGMGSFLFFCYAGGLSRAQSLKILGSALLFFWSFETLRLTSAKFNKKVMRVWGPLMRACEETRFSGTPYYIASTIFVIAIFPKPIALLSILCLAFGDPIASFFGILYGDRSIRFANGKSLIGSLAGFLACAAVAGIFLKWTASVLGLGWMNSDIAILALTAGIAGGGSELLPMEVDDNFSIPVVTGFACWVVVLFLGIDIY